MTIQPQNNNLNYLIDPRFSKVNRLFVLSFARHAEEDRRYSFSHYYVPNVKIKDFHVLTDGKSFFYLSVKNEEEAYEKIIKMNRSNDYTTGNLLDFVCFKEHCKLIPINLSKQTKLKYSQQINFIGKSEGQPNGATIFFIIEKSEKTAFEFLQSYSQKISILLNSSENEYLKFATKNCVFDSESKGGYSHHDPLKFLTGSLESSICDYFDAYILVTGTIIVTGGNENTNVAFKNCAPFKDFRTNTNDTLLIMQILLILQCLCTV